MGVLTGEDVARAVEALPRGDRVAGCRTTRPRSGRRATSGSRSPSSSRATGTSPRTRRSSWPSTTSRSSPSSTRTRRRGDPRSLASTTATSTRRSPGRDLVVRTTFRVPRFTCMPLECYGVVCDWDEAGGRLTAWANFQGPFTLHGVAAAALGLRGDRLRLAHAAGLGRLVRHQGRRPSVRRPDRARLAHARRAGALDGGPARAPRGQRCLDGAAHRARGRLHGRRRARRAALRRDRGRRRVRPRARARDALPDARLALGRLPGAERRRAEPRRAHQHAPVRPQPRVRRAAAVLRARADDGDRRAPTRARPRRARAPEPRRRRRDAVPHPVRGALRLRRLRRLPRRRARARPARTTCVSVLRARERRGGSSASGWPASSSRRSRTWATSPWRRRPSSARGRCRSRATPRARSVAIDPLGGITVRLATTPQGQGHRTVCAQVVADELGVRPEDVTVLSEMDTATVPWTVASGNYSSRFSGVGVGAVRGAPGRCARRPTRSAPTSATLTLSLRRVAGTAHWNPESLARRRWSPVSRRSRSGRRRTSTRRMPRTGSRRPERTAFSSTSAPSRSTARPGP